MAQYIRVRVIRFSPLAAPHGWRLKHLHLHAVQVSRLESVCDAGRLPTQTSFATAQAVARRFSALEPRFGRRPPVGNR